MKIILAVLVLIIAIIAVPRFLSPSTDNPSGKAVTGLPWQVEPIANGDSRVFGLTLGTSTLADARNRFGSDLILAIVAAPGETGAVEIYFQDVTLGAVTGKMIVAAAIAGEDLERMRQRATKVAYMEGSTKKWTLDPNDQPAAYAARIRALNFIPAINLDEEIVLQRFGKPAERIRTSDHTEHFLYPERGLDLVLDTEGKELLQYVAPRRFAELRNPLLKNAQPTEGNTK
jgi:hypothetical protein